MRWKYTIVDLDMPPISNQRIEYQYQITLKIKSVLSTWLFSS